ncbi:MAG TPA: sugar transferase [Mucilaginibacter sp.]|nr:sugar transferase [Mucilaginibacter sp.]
MNEEKKISKPAIAFVGFEPALFDDFKKCDFRDMESLHFANSMHLVSEWMVEDLNIVAIISFGEILAPSGLPLIEAIKKRQLPEVPFFLVANQLNSNLRIMALKAGVADIFRTPIKPSQIEKRVNFFIDNWQRLNVNKESELPQKKGIGFAKRAFDILFAGTALILLSPLLLVIYLLIKLESKGPAFYYALRVGSGYRVFKFYKFRSMYVNADKRLKELKHLNQYNIDAATEKQPTEADHQRLCSDCVSHGKCGYPLFADNVQWCERDFRQMKKTGPGSAFFKIKNDPRITRIGHFIRNTSIDELPQLWNVIIGDMSIVGNRPLPLYEAERLTTDKYALRFSAPAGITGLWQVEKRGKGEMSEEERLMLDNTYAKNHSLKNDIKLILKTIPALLQKESV